MHQHPVLPLHVPHCYPSGFWRMSDYTCHHAVASRQPATAASTERLLAEVATHHNDAEIMCNFQRMLRVTIGDWQRTDAIAMAAKVRRR